MKKSILTTLVVTALTLSGVTFALAGEKTVTGMASCGKDHETVIKVGEGATAVTYHLAQNDASKKFHSKVCHKAAKVTATGDVTDAEGKLQLAATKIELAEK